MSNTYNQIFTKGTESQLASTPIVNGKIRYTTDTNRFFIDGDVTRQEITDIIKGYTAAEIISLQNPLQNKFYLSSDTKVFYFYTNNTWNVVSGDAASIGYDNTESGLTATTLQDAIDELESKKLDDYTVITYAEWQLLTPEQKAATNYYIPDYPNEGLTMSADAVTYDNTTSGLVSSDVQNAIDEVKSGIPTDYVKLSNNGLQTIANTASGTQALAIQSGDDTSSRIVLKNSSGSNLGSLGIYDGAPSYWSAAGNASEIALANNVIKTSYTEAQTITTTAADYSYPLRLQSTHTNLSLIRFDDSTGTEYGRIGVNSSNKPVFFYNSSVNEIALTNNTLNSKSFVGSFAANTVGWHKVFLVENANISYSNASSYLITWESRYATGQPSSGCALLMLGYGGRKLIPLGGFLKNQVTKLRISGSNLSNNSCQIDAYYSTNAANPQYFKITSLSSYSSITVLDGSLDTSTSTQEINAGDEVLTNSTGVQTSAGGQTITQKSSTAAVLYLKSGTSARSLLGFYLNNDTFLGYLGINSSEEPIFYNSNGEKKLVLLNTLKSVVAASSDFADFKSRIAAL